VAKIFTKVSKNEVCFKTIAADVKCVNLWSYDSPLKMSPLPWYYTLIKIKGHSIVILQMRVTPNTQTFSVSRHALQKLSM